MAPMPHMKTGNTSSQHTWVYKTHSTQGCLQQVTEAHLRQAATKLEEADAWVQLDQNLKYVLISVRGAIYFWMFSAFLIFLGFLS